MTIKRQQGKNRIFLIVEEQTYVFVSQEDQLMKACAPFGAQADIFFRLYSVSEPGTISDSPDSGIPAQELRTCRLF